MSKSNSIILEEKQIYEIKSLASDTRKFFGVYPNVPIANDIKLLLENQGIMLCEYPFPDTNGTHTYGNITWFKTENETLTFIGLNTSSFYDEQIFAIAHEIGHYMETANKSKLARLIHDIKHAKHKAIVECAYDEVNRQTLELKLKSQDFANEVRDTLKLMQDCLDNNDYSKSINDLEALLEKGIKTIVHIKTNDFTIEDYFVGRKNDKIILESKEISINDIVELNIIKFKKC